MFEREDLDFLSLMLHQCILFHCWLLFFSTGCSGVLSVVFLLISVTIVLLWQQVYEIWRWQFTILFLVILLSEHVFWVASVMSY